MRYWLFCCRWRWTCLLCRYRSLWRCFWRCRPPLLFSLDRLMRFINPFESPDWSFQNALLVDSYNKLWRLWLSPVIYFSPRLHQKSAGMRWEIFDVGTGETSISGRIVELFGEKIRKRILSVRLAKIDYDGRALRRAMKGESRRSRSRSALSRRGRPLQLRVRGWVDPELMEGGSEEQGAGTEAPK